MPRRTASRASPHPIYSPDAPYSLINAVREFEHRYVENVMHLTDGNLDEAAALLGIAPQELRDFVLRRHNTIALKKRLT